MKQTPMCDRHSALGARMVEFAGWQMPVQYRAGIIAEHLAVRRGAGVFDVSHMGRFRITGEGAEAYLRFALTNDCRRLPAGMAHYTFLANERGGAIDDAFLYRPAPDKYLLVVNASNKDRDEARLREIAADFDVLIEDVSASVAMIAVQGPQSETVLQKIMTAGELPPPKRNAIGRAGLVGHEVCLTRTGYTGEPVCFELFLAAQSAPAVWDALVENGAEPIGLGARDTLRLEAGLPLYGHELGVGPDGEEIPIFAVPQASAGVSFHDAARDFAGREPLLRQQQARARYKQNDFFDTAALPKVIRPFLVLEGGIARQGCAVSRDGVPAGHVTSGTMVPYWDYEDQGDAAVLKDTFFQRAIGLCLIRPDIAVGEQIAVDVRGRALKARIVARQIDNRSGTIATAIMEQS